MKPGLRRNAVEPVRLVTVCMGTLAALAWIAAPAAAAEAKKKPAEAGTPTRVSGDEETPVPGDKPKGKDLVLEGGSDGTVFRTLTIEGEDRIRIEIQRPSLNLDLSPASAPGLELGGAEDVLNRTRPDLELALLDAVAQQPSERTARPWLESLSTGPVARFRPDLTDVETWSLTVTDARGRTAARFEGKGKPPKDLAWDGRGTGKEDAALPGLTYSYVLEAVDKAGNRRHFVGEGFEVPARRAIENDAVTLAFPGGAIARAERTAGAMSGNDPFLAEVATWVNQAPAAAPITIRVYARTHAQGETLARTVHEGMRPMLVGDPSRVRANLVVEPDAPAAGAVRVTTGR
jgi:hypothetical protein